jgi:hypothetical protein
MSRIKKRTHERIPPNDQSSRCEGMCGGKWGLCQLPHAEGETTEWVDDVSRS